MRYGRAEHTRTDTNNFVLCKLRTFCGTGDLIYAHTLTPLI